MGKKSKPIFYKCEGDAIIEDSVLCSFLDITSDKNERQLSKIVSNISRVIEGFVFFERLFVFSYYVDDENMEGYYISKNPLILSELISELSKEKILNFVQVLPKKLSPQPSQLLEQVKIIGLIPEEKQAAYNQSNFKDFLFQQEVARSMDLPFISSDVTKNIKFIADSSNLKKKLSTELLLKINMSASKELSQYLKFSRRQSLFIPPFLAITLNMVVKGASFSDAIFDLRDQFKSLRMKFVEFESEFQDTSKDLRHQVIKTSKIIKDIEKISSPFAARDRTTLSIWGDVFDLIIDSSTDLDNFSPMKEVGLIRKLGKLSKDVLDQIILKRRYSSVYKLKSDFYNIKQYNQLLNKAILPYEESAKEKWPQGYICVAPGNPFSDPQDLM